jgi:hypothetical protein
MRSISAAKPFRLKAVLRTIFEENESCKASYAASRGQIFVRTREILYCIGAAGK